MLTEFVIPEVTSLTLHSASFPSPGSNDFFFLNWLLIGDEIVGGVK